MSIANTSKETVRILLEPLPRSSIGTEGIFDLYIMPAYDDIATLFSYQGEWHPHHDSSMADSSRESEDQPLSKGVFERVLENLIRDAA
jgi:hypothetical protein